MEAIAATQGVYRRLKTSNEQAESVPMTADTPPSVLNRTFRIETTLSFAIKPLTREVTIRQSPRPTGLNSGTRKPEMVARMLFCESYTRFSRKSKLCRNQTTIVAIRITENAL